MPKKHPEYISLKHAKCPECKTAMEHAQLTVDGDAVKAGCCNKDCGYSVELFWLGEAHPSMN